MTKTRTKAGNKRKRPARKNEGRPTKYNEELADKILGQLVSGKSLRRIMKDDDMPNIDSIFEWVRNHQKFSERYKEARQMQAEFFIDEIMEIADGTVEDVQRSRLMVDTRKWYASKIIPKIYGDKLTTEDVTKDKPVEMTINLSRE